MNIIEQFALHKVVPVIKLDEAKNAVPLGKALMDGGLPVAEITFRTAAAEESIYKMHKAYPDIIIGAGSITKVEQVKRACDAGASFIVTPGFSHNVTEYCVTNNIPITPGACTPTEIMFILEYGLEVAKFFPAAQYGGVETIKALSAPFPQVKFMPTGGINEQNIKKYLAFDKIIACGGSWMVKDSLIQAGDFEKITQLTKEAVSIVQSEA